MEENVVEIFSIAASIASVILAVIAIAMSIFFYTQSKNTESSVKESLSGIRTQTDSLQKLTGRWMDRLTKYVTSPKENTDTTEQVRQLLQSLPENIAEQIKLPATSENAALTSEIVTSYIALYYYSAVANVWAQFSLPPLNKYDDNPDYSALVSRVVDGSAADFQHMAKLLASLDQAEVQSNSLKHLLDEAMDLYRDRVATTTQVYAKRAEDE